ncbi:MAG: hypothetical protein K2X39_01805, partial [Silvanigrellaceae bacterium]|nr:hypothetical protein [Silvanigrellaceae bacterium]
LPSEFHLPSMLRATNFNEFCKIFNHLVSIAKKHPTKETEEASTNSSLFFVLKHNPNLDWIYSGEKNNNVAIPQQS